MAGCTIRCSNIFAGEDGEEIVSPVEYETLGLLGTNCGLTDPDEAQAFVEQSGCDSLAVAIGFPDFVSVANTTMNQTGQSIEGVALIMAVYLIFSLSTSAFMNWYNKKVALVER